MITQEVCKFVLSFFLHSKTSMVCGFRRLHLMVYEEMLFKILHLGVLTFFSFAKDFPHLFFFVIKGIFSSTRSVSTSQSKKWPNWGGSSSVQGFLTQMYMLRTLSLLLQLFDEGQGGNKKELLLIPKPQIFYCCWNRPLEKWWWSSCRSSLYVKRIFF